MKILININKKLFSKVEKRRLDLDLDKGGKGQSGHH